MARIALVMIARDSARYIERALASAHPYVDSSIVLDLGSRDDTAQRARRAGAHVTKATWHDDPSLLWNQALSAANADWHLILEAHEWIDSGAHQLEHIRTWPPNRVGLIEIIPGATSRGAEAPHLQPRILPGSVRFTGRFHPEPAYPGMKTHPLPTVIACDDADVLGWSLDRNLVGAAVAQALFIHPDDPRILAELGKWQRAQGDPSAAAGSFARAADALAPGLLDRHTYVMETLDALRAAKRHSDALALIDAEMGQWEKSPDFPYLVGELFFDMILADPNKAATLAPMAEACWKRAMSIGDTTNLPGTVTGRGSFLAAQAMAVMHTTLQHPDEADHWFAKAHELRSAAPYAARPRLLG
ncbi:hypothetical protein [Dermatophilus congolensis]|uniref:hypothetical protein n=1 Tax=Dermatophilus congolensis TaxID=1863 RepID=UPI001AAE9DDB|nr:hypothetical protein [Dermatophilus congolensis]MBO3143435.1 hypothetical protein [Dermatophilus congolensis]MBO3152425.1 hypothetical protein [Dermatophilus congolensis]MBO3160563.1 hypothetical protein [Dermatophilus congolensis]MBO3163712.1 hypothetical protein [Dermatophilus congolensis]MBO3177258.1 hypothetical protein [Dermatophilus congolensis]